MYRATEKHKSVRAVKSKPKVLGHFKVDHVLKTDETFSYYAYFFYAKYNAGTWSE